MELKHTPELLREQGFVNIEDLCKLLGLSRTGFYNFLHKIPGKVKRVKVGQRSYYEIAPILEFIKQASTWPER